MSATIVFPIIPQLSGWSLGTNVRSIKDSNGNACRIELSPQSPLAAGEFETAQSWSSGSSLGSWSILNSGNINTLDEHTSWLSGMYCYLPASGTALDFDGGTHS